MKNGISRLVLASVAVLSLVIILVAGAVDTSAAQVELETTALGEGEQTVEFHGDWQVRCVNREGLPPCEMLQMANHNETGETLMRMSLIYLGARNEYLLVVWVPLGVVVSDGAVIRIDEKKNVGVEGLDFTRCEEDGCLIEGLLSPEDIEPFRQGVRGHVIYRNNERNSVGMPVSFKGFTAAVDIMTNRNTNWEPKAHKEQAR